MIWREAHLKQKQGTYAQRRCDHAKNVTAHHHAALVCYRTQLFAHNTMQEETKKVDPYDYYDGTGVLGRAKDVLAANGYNIDAISIDQSSVALDGSPGVSAASFVVPRNGVNTFATRPQKDVRPQKRIRGEKYFDIEGYGFSGIFAEQWSDVIFNGVRGATSLKSDLERLSNSSSAIWESNAPYKGSALSVSLKAVSQLMQTHSSRKTDRDVFYVECKLVFMFRCLWVPIQLA
jgi:hypothetical protein